MVALMLPKSLAPVVTSGVACAGQRDFGPSSLPEQRQRRVRTAPSLGDLLRR